ncbi:MAG: phage tail sheath family protein [Chitinivibrionia bacterium]|nr:phage tail sheath family protein [Chitinivibrionia bacterium]
MAFFHGVRSRQVPTALVPSARVGASLVMAFGCAPVHRLPADIRDKALPGSIHLIFSNAEAAQLLGIDAANDNFEKWGLSEVAFSQFTLFGNAPVIFANVFDPSVHFHSVTNETLEFTEGVAVLANPDVIDDAVIKDSSAQTVFVKDTDYTINPVTGVITATQGASLESAITQGAAISATYKYAAPQDVSAAEVIGGFDFTTGKSTGLELVEQAFPRFVSVPGILIAPNFSNDPTVAAILAAKTQNINGVFNAVCFADIPSQGQNAVKIYTDAAEYKNANNLTSPDLYLCYPKVKFGDRLMNMSTQAAGIMAIVDRENGDIPFASPSNKNLQCQAAIVDGEELSLSLTQANFLNQNGIATALNFVGGWKMWGNRTTAYPANTDPKDVFVSNRRFLAWYGNRLVLTWFQKVDFPINRRLIQTILNSEAIFINSLSAAGAVTGGRIEFNEEENSILDLMDGNILFHGFFGLVAPAEQIEFLLEYDPSYLQTLFA